MLAAYYICAIVTAASAFTSLAFSIIAVRNSQDDNSKINAFYASARSIALAVASIAPFFCHSVTWLATVATIMIAVQALDALIGLRIRDALKIYGPAITAFTNLIVLIWLLSTD